ncbi:GyrI-like domain-containing protein [Methanogenium sp. S4BF]|uniref:GyrI-like domain-containing protein n=1 Tax=Methanogenium sp. S4BF TaxID=1789226 RepID=UPI002416B4B5|nr:GyrI-like domain-containing protein [Methanogenium sp. S4BF]WFN34628.1 GyrI-like domain-containing protein [Methanogenium sp. S4BF]
MTDFTIAEIAPQMVIGMRRQGFYQEQIPAMIMELFLYVEEKGIEIAGMPIFVCHETSPEEAMRAAEEGNADIEVALPVAAPVAITDDGPADLTCYELPGGPMLRATHRGPYETSETTYYEIFAWLEQQGKQITGPIREVYLNDPAEVAAEDILTEIYVPVG